MDKNKANEALRKEALSHTLYKLYGQRARDAGFEAVAKDFFEASENELAHAELFFDEIFGDVGVSSYLKLAVADEKEDSDGYHEWHAEDGNVRLKALSEVERKHYEVFERTLKRMEDNTLFDDSVPTAWECCRCGFEARGRSAPTVCPLCFASQGSFYRE